jgi:hypothetical protein
LAAAKAVVVYTSADRHEQISFILRPDASGRWHIQDDDDHAASGVSHTVEQTETFVRVFFLKTYTHAGVIQITPDDGFNGLITAGASLGRSNATITLAAQGKTIDPAKVWSHAREPNNGNLWVSVSMVERPPR